MKKGIIKVAKGKRKEKLCADELRAEGYIIWKTVRHKFLNIDLFGLFDVVALHPEGEHIRFIQVKSNRIDQKTRDAIKSLKMPVKCWEETWVYRDIYRRRNVRGEFRKEKNVDCRRIIRSRCCPNCREWFDIESVDKDQIYCGMDCYRKQQRKNQIIKICEVCNKEFTVSKSASIILKHCSRKCYGVALGKSMEGEKHPRWRGGIDTAHKKGLNSMAWQKIRKIILKRDDHRCQRCRATSNELHIHHIVPYRISQDNSEANLVTFCPSCHMTVEQRINRWGWVKEMYD